MKLAWLGVALAVAACGGGDDDDLTGVTIAATTRFISPSGDVTQPTDLSMEHFVAYDPVTLARTPATGDVLGAADGTAAIPGVPAGPYVLSYGTAGHAPFFELRTERAVVWTSATVGRDDSVAAPASTTVEPQVTGMSPWGQDDWYELTSFNDGAMVEPSSAVDASAALPEVGATTFDETFDWRSGFPPPALLDPARGDTLTLGHYVGSTRPDGSRLQLLAQTATLTPPAQTGGANLVLAGAFTDLAPTVPVTLHADLGAALAAAPLTSADTYLGWNMTVTASAWTNLGVAEGLAPIGILGVADSGVGTTGPAMMPALDASWQPLVTAQLEWITAFTAGGTSVGIEGGTWAEDAFAGGVYDLPATVPFASNVTVQGASPAGQAIAWDGATPITVAFDAPAEANHTGFALLRLDPGQPFATLVAYANTDGANRIALPPALFAHGVSYALTVSVYAEDGMFASHGSSLNFGAFTLGP